MIIDKIENIQRYKVISSPELLNYVRQFDVSHFTEGRQDIIGNDLFDIGLIYKTQCSADGEWEGHQKYIDIHWIIEGEEIIEVADVADSKIKQAYSDKDDYALFEVEKAKAKSIQVSQGYFLVLFPEEVHKTAVWLGEVKEVKKRVLKLKL